MQVFKIDTVYSIRMGDNTKRYVTLSDNCVVLIPALVGTWSASCKVDQFLKYLDCIRQCDCFSKEALPKSKKCIFVAVTTMGFTVSILFFDMALWLVLSTKRENFFFVSLYYFPYYLCYCFTMVIELLYWQSVYSIKVRLVALNEQLEGAVANECSLFTKIHRTKINNLVDTLQVDSSKKTAMTTEDVGDLIISYQKLVEATRAVNDYFGFIILLVILGCLIHLLVTPFYLYALIFNTGNSMFIVSQSIWMIGHVLRILLIVEPCHGCLMESRMTSALVCKLLCSEHRMVIKEQLEFFLVYLSECRIEFTAFGLTTIYRGLITGIAGAVTTYLVILFQF